MSYGTPTSVSGVSIKDLGHTGGLRHIARRLIAFADGSQLDSEVNRVCSYPFYTLIDLPATLCDSSTTIKVFSRLIQASATVEDKQLQAAGKLPLLLRSPSGLGFFRH